LAEGLKDPPVPKVGHVKGDPETPRSYNCTFPLPASKLIAGRFGITKLGEADVGPLGVGKFVVSSDPEIEKTTSLPTSCAEIMMFASEAAGMAIQRVAPSMRQAPARIARGNGAVVMPRQGMRLDRHMADSCA
jgi:hypothetical protein